LVHAYKGTRFSIERALAALRVGTVITEWWERTPHAIRIPDVDRLLVAEVRQELCRRALGIFDVANDRNVDAAPLVHAYKGTRFSIERALAALRVGTVITEWWEPLDPIRIPDVDRLLVAEVRQELCRRALGIFDVANDRAYCAPYCEGLTVTAEAAEDD
jgi:P2-related tail formation protein